MSSPLPPFESLVQKVLETPLLKRDQARLQTKIAKRRQRSDRRQPVDRGCADLEHDLDQAAQRWQHFQKLVPALDYPEDLPVSRERVHIIDILQQHQVVIVCGDTGSGKTTQLPKMIFEAGGGNHGKIGITQPRRLAATGMARRVAEECQSELGRTVGYQVRFDDRSRADTRIQFMTDGMLLAHLARDPDWLEFDTLMIDEAHERSLNIDFILGCLHDLLPRRPDLKVVISSATLDAERFSEFFHQAPVIQVEGRLYPIEDVYLPVADEDQRDTADQVLEALQYLDKHHAPLDTLVFLPGEREIRDTARKLEGVYRDRAQILPLFARLNQREQQRVFSQGTTRRVILATNVAETSLTLPGIRAVIDTGLVRIHRVDPRAQVQRLLTESVSQASAKQRRGRCGRTGPGVCIRLYREEDLESAAPHTDPEIRRSSLAEVILRMAVLGLPPLTKFPLIDPPKGASISEGYRTLYDIGAMTRNRDLTLRGRRLAQFPLEPRLARMLEEGHEEKVLPAVLVVATFLSIQDPRERPKEKMEAADRAHAPWKDPQSDFVSLLNMWNDICQNTGSRTRLRKFCQNTFLNARRVEEWMHMVDDLRETCANQEWPVPGSVGEMTLQDTDALHRALLAGVPRMIGQREENQTFRAPNGQLFQVFPGSTLGKKPPKWVMAHTLLETSKLFARECAQLNPDWVVDVAPHLCKWQYERPVWNAARGFVEAEERVVFGELTLRHGQRVHYGRVDPAAAREIFIMDGLLPGNLKLRHPSYKAYLDLRASLAVWEHKLRRPGYFTDATPLTECLKHVLPAEISSTHDFEKWIQHHDWVPDMRQLVGNDDIDPTAFPDQIQISKQTIHLHYAFAPDDPDQDGLTLSLPETALNHLPEEILEWTIPAWMPEKVDALIRTLDKPLRNACQPIPETARDAISWFTSQNFFWTHSLRQALAAFLAARLNRILAAADLQPEKLPPHLVTKLLVTDAKGKALHRGHAFPGHRDLPASRKTSLPKAAHNWEQHGCRDWPDTELPEEITFQGQTYYPALVDEGTACGTRLYPQADTALAHHRAGVLKLFRIRYPDPVRFLEKKFPLPTRVQLDLVVLQREGEDLLSDMLSGVLTEAMNLQQALPRTAADFRQAADRARGELFEIAEARGRQLGQILDLRTRVREALETTLPPKAQADLELQQTLLWSAGWIRDPENLARYPVYLQGILNRIERLRRDPAKDARKQENLEPALEHLSNVTETFSSTQLRAAFRKIEELRLSIFCPECRPSEKISVQRFQTWLDLQATPARAAGHSV